MELKPWNLGTSTISWPRRGTWNLGTRNLRVYMGLLVQQKVLHTGRRVEEGGVNHGIKYVKAKCKLASVVHDAFGGIASCNSCNLEVRFDSWTCIASYTTCTVTLPPGLRLYGFGTWTRYFTSCSSHLCVNISHQINTKVKTERDTPANTHGLASVPLGALFGSQPSMCSIHILIA